MTTPPKTREEWEPIRIDQTITGSKGNCQSACLAMILGLPVSSVPNFFDGLELDDPDLSEKWNQAEMLWLESFGWASITLNVEGGFFRKHFSKGFVIASGQSVRGLSHAVVYKDGELWHDPFPGGQGVDTVREVEVVYPLYPFLVKQSGDSIMSLQAEVERLRDDAKNLSDRLVESRAEAGKAAQQIMDIRVACGDNGMRDHKSLLTHIRNIWHKSIEKARQPK